MNRRRNLIVASLSILLLILMLIPVARMLSFGADHALDQKQGVIARALEMEHERNFPLTLMYSSIWTLRKFGQLKTRE